MRNPLLLTALLLLTTLARAGELFPVVHTDTLAVRLVDSRDGRPISHQHVLLTGGYDERDLRLQLWQQDAITGEDGLAMLNSQLVNLPLLSVALQAGKLCRQSQGFFAYSTDRIRRWGLVGDNHCGLFVAMATPGVLTLAARSAKSTPDAAPTPPATPPSAPLAAPAHAPAPAQPIQTSDDSEALTPEEMLQLGEGV